MLRRKFYRKVGGIYKLFFKGKENLFYIGRTSNFKERKQSHLSMLRNNRHHSKKLQKDYNTNPSNFVFKVVEVVECCEKQKKLEQKYLDKNPFYNQSKNSKGGRKKSVLTSIKNLPPSKNKYQLVWNLCEKGNKAAILYWIKERFGNPKTLIE